MRRFIRQSSWGVIAIALFITARPARSAITMKIRPVGLTPEQSRILTSLVIQRPEIQARLDRDRYRILDARFSDGRFGDGSPDRYQIEIYDYTRDRLLEVRGSLDQIDSMKVRDSQARPPATPEEFQEAVRILKNDPYFGPLWGKYQPYRAMPGVVVPPISDFGLRPERIVTVGLRPKSRSFKQEIVGVSLSRGRIFRYERGAPPTATAVAELCGPEDSGLPDTERGTPGQAEVVVQDENQTLWKFLVVRPANSSGFLGSGIDLRNIEFKGKRVLTQLHVPILNVKYDADICGPYRDWGYAEHPFRAEGSLIADGILQASSRPRTIFDDGDDDGNFAGVAIYAEGGRVILVSELEAGWYRYVSQYSFDSDGSIEPRWGFAAVQDSCTCNRHHHHAYWRMDFDIGAQAAKNMIQVFDGTTWTAVSTEAVQNRDAAHQRWRVMNPATGDGYEIIPGSNDSTAAGDPYGKGDAWLLKYEDGEIDDSDSYTGTSGNIDAFANDESIENEDVVFWYGAHFDHHYPDLHPVKHIVGPRLVPVHW